MANLYVVGVRRYGVGFNDYNEALNSARIMAKEYPCDTVHLYALNEKDGLVLDKEIVEE